jgi:hypothetical protein
MRGRGKVIRLRELNRFIFSPDYKPQCGPRGEHELQFTAQNGQCHLSYSWPITTAARIGSCISVATSLTDLAADADDFTSIVEDLAVDS